MIPKKTFQNSMHGLLGLIVIVSIAMTLATLKTSPKEESPQTYAATECQVAPATIQTEVKCWAEEAVNFVVNSNLFSIASEEDMRDAVKYYRFYNLVVSELANQ